MSVREKIAKAVMDRIRAFHSSPHDFDKFDISKIGTGEGARAYGHGLYFAENPKVSGQGGEYWQQFLDDRFEGTNDFDLALLLQKHGFDRAKAAAAVRRQIDVNERALAEQLQLADKAPFQRAMEGTVAANRMRRRELAQIESGAQIGPRTYEVDIRARPDELLDWDAPLAAQSNRVIDVLRPALEKRREAQEAARTTILRRGTDAFGRPLDPQRVWDLNKQLPPLEEMAGQEIYKQMGLPAVSRQDAYPSATGRLLDAGIVGHRYLDAGSRGVTPARAAIEPPTHNYVIYDPERIEIMKKYAVPGAIGAGTAAQGAFDDPFGQNYGVSP